MANGGRKVEARRWCKKGYGVTVGEPSGDLAGHVGSGCTPVHPEKELSKDDGPRKGLQAIRGVRGVRVAKAESVHRVCRFMRK